MGTRAYLMINLAEEARTQDGYVAAIKELETMPEVIAVDPVFGIYDLVVQVEAPIRVIFTAHKIMEKKWLKRLNILRPFEPDAASGARPLLGDYVRTPVASKAS